MAFELVKRYEGQTMKVLVEQADREVGKVQGRSTGNKLVHFLGSQDLIGKTVDVKITKAFPAVFRGELI
ncbi:(Dimethylallyl)adenosine tRNA methylthiotransferase MiaB [compost metagenome]